MSDIDQHSLRRAQAKVAAGYADADFFCAEVNTRLLERLALFSLQPERILDLGAGTGIATGPLRAAYPEAELVQLDWSLPMLSGRRQNTAQRICADSHALPFADASFAMAVSNMMLPGCADPEQVFREVRRVLTVPGVFLFSTLGPDTLKELRRAWARVDSFTHVHEFADMHNVGDALVRAGFVDPVMDVEKLTVRYTGIDALVRDLRGIAATNLSRARNPGLTTPGRWQQMLAALDSARNADGKLEITLEIVTGQAWTNPPGRGVTMADGEARFPLSRLNRQR